jgi:hypothetical protein
MCLNRLSGTTAAAPAEILEAWRSSNLGDQGALAIKEAWRSKPHPFNRGPAVGQSGCMDAMQTRRIEAHAARLPERNARASKQKGRREAGPL